MYYYGDGGSSPDRTLAVKLAGTRALYVYKYTRVHRKKKKIYYFKNKKIRVGTQLMISAAREDDSKEKKPPPREYIIRFRYALHPPDTAAAAV